MEQFEKVCKGLECCIESNGSNCPGECPYKDICFARIGTQDIYVHLLEDALALIRQQRERIMELEAQLGQRDDTRGEVGMNFVNRICPKCNNPNYVVSLGNFSNAFPYKCMNCNSYLLEEDFLSVQQDDNNGWISVKERLPEMYKAVLGYAPYHKNVWAVTMRENGEWYIWSPLSRRYDPDFEGPITHWMPMPEPPKECSTDETHA